jgi:23S rRNA pseudouridine1911/1915/1917 synthase
LKKIIFTNGEEGNIDIIYEDDSFIIVNKEAGIIVHPTGGIRSGTLFNYLIKYFDKNNIKGKPRFINRLDKDTSGIVIVAKNEYIQESFSREGISK